MKTAINIRIMNKASNITLSTIFIFFLILLFGGNLKAQDVPYWFKNIEMSNYQSQSYFRGLGSGQTSDEAYEKAMNELAMQIQVSIKSSSYYQSSEKVEKTLGESDIIKFDYKQHIENAIQITSNETITGAEIVKKEIINGEHFALAVLEKSSFINDLNKKLDRKHDTINLLLSNADKNLGNGNITLALKKYEAATTEIPVFFSDLSLYESISNNTYEHDIEAYAIEIKDKIATILQDLKLEVIEGENQSSTVGETLPEPIVVRATYKNQSGKHIPISSIRLIARHSDKSLIARTYSDNNGKATFSARTITPKYGSQNFITVELSLDDLPLRISKANQNRKVKVYYNVNKQSSMALSISMKDNYGNKLKSVSNRVSSALSKMGHNVQSSAPLELNGKVSTLEKREIKTMGNPQTIMKIKLVTEFVVSSSNELIGTYTFESRGLSTNSETGAINAALETLDFQEPEFVSQIHEWSKQVNSLFTATATSDIDDVESQPEEISVSDQPTQKIIEEKTITEKTSKPEQTYLMSRWAWIIIGGLGVVVIFLSVLVIRK